MAILALYIFLKDGRCAFCQTYSSDAPSPDFFGPLFAALDSFAKAMVGQEMQGLEMGNIRVHAGEFGLYYVLMATDPTTKIRTEKISALIDQIGFKFWEMYFQEIGEWNGNLVRFNAFDDICRNIVDLKQGKILPTKDLDAISIIQLDKPLQDTALALLDKGGKATAAELAHFTSKSETQERKTLETLVSQGYVGRDRKGDELQYFIDEDTEQE